MVLDFNQFTTTITQANHPEELRSILVRLFREVSMRWTNRRVEQTGFENATEEELHSAFYRTANELLIRWGLLQDQLGNTIVGILQSRNCLNTHLFPRISLKPLT